MIYYYDMRAGGGLNASSVSLSQVTWSVTVARLHLCFVMSERLRNREKYPRLRLQFMPYFANGTSGRDWCEYDI